MYETIRGWITRAGLSNRGEVAGLDDWMADVGGPMLSDEVDMQAWLSDRLRTRPQGEMRTPAAGPAWRPDDYAEMAEGRRQPIAEGGPVVSDEEAGFRLREAMSAESEWLLPARRPDPWDLRGDRVVAPVGPYPDPTDGEVVEAMVARELGTVAELVAVTGANIAAARSLMAESDARLDLALGTEERRVAMAMGALAMGHLGALGSEAPGSWNAVPAGGGGLGVVIQPPADVISGAGSPAAMEGTMNTRVQLTEYVGNEYTGAANFEVDGASPAEVRKVLEAIQDISLARHAAAVGAGTAPPKGGVRVRIQLQPKPTRFVDGRRMKCEPAKGAGYENLRTRGMSVSEVAPLVNHQLKLHFGIREGDPAELVGAWGAFAGAAPEASVEAEDVASPAVPVMPGLSGRGYSRRVHLGLFCVVKGMSLRVSSLWEREKDAVAEARRTGARVVDSDGYLVPERGTMAEDG